MRKCGIFLATIVRAFSGLAPTDTVPASQKGMGGCVRGTLDLVWNCSAGKPHLMLKMHLQEHDGPDRFNMFHHKIMAPDDVSYLDLTSIRLLLDHVSHIPKDGEERAKTFLRGGDRLWRCSDRLKPQHDKSTRVDLFVHAPEDGCDHVIQHRDGGHLHGHRLIDGRLSHPRKSETCRSIPQPRRANSLTEQVPTALCQLLGLHNATSSAVPDRLSSPDDTTRTLLCGKNRATFG